VRATTFDGTTTTDLSVEQARAWSSDAPFSWIDVRTDGPQDAAAEQLLAALGLTPVQVALALRTDVAGLFIASATGVLATTWLAGAGASPAELHVGWTPGRLLTVHSCGDAAIAQVRQQMTVRGPALFAEPSRVLGVFLQLVLLGVDDDISSLSVAVDEVDQAVLQGAAPEQLAKLRRVRSTVQAWELRLPRYATAVDGVLVAAAELPGMDEPGAQQLEAYAVQLRDTIQRLHGVAGDLRNAVQDYQTQVGNAQGDRINQLTVVSVLFLPVTFLTGYFGMNFTWLDDAIGSVRAWLLLGVLVPVLMVAGSAYLLSRRGYSLRLGRERQDRA
jgi:magnesium transporter